MVLRAGEGERGGQEEGEALLDWAGLGDGGWSIRLRELEFSMRRMFRPSRQDPEAELPEVDLSDAEQQGAVRREAARRMITERR